MIAFELHFDDCKIAVEFGPRSENYEHHVAKAM